MGCFQAEGFARVSGRIDRIAIGALVAVRLSAVVGRHRYSVIHVGHWFARNDTGYSYLKQGRLVGPCKLDESAYRRLCGKQMKSLADSGRVLLCSSSRLAFARFLGLADHLDGTEWIQT